MNLESQIEAGVLVARPSGLIDHIAAAGFEAAMAPLLLQCNGGSNGLPLVLDLSGLDYISSAGLRVLMLAAKQAKTQNGHIVLAAPQPVVKEILEISRFHLVFALLPSVDAAREHLTATRRTDEA